MSPKSVRNGNSAAGTATAATTSATSVTGGGAGGTAGNYTNNGSASEMEESGLSEAEHEAGNESENEAGESSDEEEEEEEASEDSSDMDVQECEKKRYEFIDDLTDLEKQFAILREQLYRERMTQIEARLSEVRAGKAVEYLQPLDELETNLKNRLEVSEILRKLRLENIHCKYEAEELATQQNYESEKELLWDSIREDLENKIHLLEEDKNNVDFSTGLWEANSCGGTGGNKSRRRKADPMDPDRRKKPVTTTGPYIIYMLRESDILDDWTLIKKALASRLTKTECKTFSRSKLSS